MRLENTGWIAQSHRKPGAAVPRGWAIVAAGLAWSVAAAGSAAASTAVSYVGPGNGTWNIASNWSPAGVPANSGSSEFTVTIASNSVVFNLAGNTAIDDLILSKSLQLNSGCNLTVTNQLSLSTASITAKGGNFTANGPATTATDISLDAESGAQVVMPALGQITDDNVFFGGFQANGAGSLLDLSQVTTMAVTTLAASVKAGSGGEVNLHNLLAVTSTNGNTLGLTASAGTVNVSSLGGGSSNSGVGSVTLSNSGVVLWGSPTSLNTLSLTVTGTGNTINLSQIATATAVSFDAEGGAQVSLPVLAQITNNNPFLGHLQANGAGSLLDLSHVTTMAVGISPMSVQAASGGKVNLDNLLSVSSPNGSAGITVSLTASGGTIDASNLGGGTSNSGVGSVILSNSGTVLWGSPTSLNTLSLKVTGPGNTIDLERRCHGHQRGPRRRGRSAGRLPGSRRLRSITFLPAHCRPTGPAVCWTFRT